MLSLILQNPGMEIRITNLIINHTKQKGCHQHSAQEWTCSLRQWHLFFVIKLWEACQNVCATVYLYCDSCTLRHKKYEGSVTKVTIKFKVIQNVYGCHSLKKNAHIENCNKMKTKNSRSICQIFCWSSKASLSGILLCILPLEAFWW